MIPNASGKTAPPTPWIARATISSASVWTTAAITLPTASVPRTTSSTSRLPNMSPSRPAIGVTTDVEIRNDVKTHAIPAVDACRSLCSTGSAGTTSDCRSAYAVPASMSTARIARGRIRSSCAPLACSSQ